MDGVHVQEENTGLNKISTLSPHNLDSIEAERKRIIAQLAFLDTLLLKIKKEEEERTSLEVADHVSSHPKTTRSQMLSRHGSLTLTNGWDSKPDTNNISSDLFEGYCGRQATVMKSNIDIRCSELREFESTTCASMYDLLIRSNEKMQIERHPQMQPVVDRTEVSRGIEANISKGISGLEKLSIRELHEVYRTTFGLRTSAKDKQWLIRRISLCVGSSCRVISTENEIGETPPSSPTGQVYDEMPCHQLDNRSTDAMIPRLQSLDSKFIGRLQSSTEAIEPYFACSTPNSMPEDHWIIEQLTTGAEIQDCGEHGKRKRKPTRRYIEEVTGWSDSRELVCKDDSMKDEIENFVNNSKMHCIQCKCVGNSKTKLMTGHERQHNSSKETRKILDTAIYSSAARSHNEGEMNAHPFQSTTLNDRNAFLVERTRFPKKHHRPWSVREVLKLLEGVHHCGVGKWADIKRYSFPDSVFRSSTDLKDKWRNLVRASNAHLRIARQGERHPKTSVSPVPGAILTKVRELLSKQFFPENMVSGKNNSGRILTRHRS
ncbi:hypothetical protein KP509_19G078200 [Ceratopteris richardii]|uniref:Uncharacterized protein n=2 Tax=Ceratopteris richardii TaxID=49495 RepID=A0A8T2SM01_CERRI|nr:hypothetical protein KP509_19G078200 [Ceratopteris richardii]